MTKTLFPSLVVACAFVLSAGVSAEARSITGVVPSTSGGTMTLNVTFEAGSPVVSHALYLAYAPSDMGTSIADWPVFQRVKIVLPNETSATVVPQFIGISNKVCRAFLVKNAYPFDTPVEAIRQTGTQYIDTEINPGPTTFASLDFKFDEAVKMQQRAFGVSAGSANFSFDAYINGAGYWASNCADDSGTFKASTLGAEASRVTVSLDAVSGNLVVYNHVTHASTTDSRSSMRTKTSKGPLYIFCQHSYATDEGAPVCFAAGGLIYGGVITTNGVPARSFQPCALGSRAGLYDAVSGRIFWSAVADDDFQIGGASVPFAPAEGETQVAVSDAVSLETRAITDVTFSTADSVTTVNVTFDAGAAGDNHALYVAYAPTDMGAQLAGWTALQRVKIVGAEETSATFTLLPQVTGAGNTVFRVFLVDSAYPFDRLVEAIRQSSAKTQYIDTEFYPNPTTFAALDFKLDNATTVQQRLFGVSGQAAANFAFDAYINGSKRWASACADGGGDFLEAATTAATTDRYTVSLDAKTGDHTIIKHSNHNKINKTRSTTRTKTSAGTLSIFCQHKFYDNGTTTQENFAAGGLIYAGVITTNDVPVRTYLPCALGSRAGLYDAVSGRIFWSTVANDDFTAEGASALCEPAAGETQVFASAAFDIPPTLTLPGSGEWVREVWSSADWQMAGQSVAAPVSGQAIINLSGGASLTLGADVALSSLTLNGSGKLVIFTDSHTFSAETVNAATGVKYIVIDGSAAAGVWWTGLADDDSMANGGNWEGGQVPVAGAAVNFSAIPSATTINADAGRAFGAVTMGTGVITFTNSLTATSFSDTSKVAVAADSTVTLEGNLVIDTTSGNKRIVYSVAAGGKFKVTGKISAIGTNSLWPSQVTCDGAIEASGLVCAVSGTDLWTFRLSNNGGHIGRWIIGEDGLVCEGGAAGFWVHHNANDRTEIQAAADFTIQDAWIGLSKAAAMFTIQTTSPDDIARTITAKTGFVAHETRGPCDLDVCGSGTFLCDYTAQASSSGPKAFSGVITVKDTATLAVNPEKYPTTGAISVDNGATFKVAKSGTVALMGNLTLADGAALAFNFTDRNTPPQLALSTGKTMTASGAVNVKISGEVWPKSGEHILTTCGGFTAANVTLAEGAPKWVRGLSVNAAGNIVLNVKPMGVMVIVM